MHAALHKTTLALNEYCPFNDLAYLLSDLIATVFLHNYADRITKTDLCELEPRLLY